MSVADFKANFSAVVKVVVAANRIATAYSKKKEIKAILIPAKKQVVKKRKLDILEGKGLFKMCDNFTITEEELMGLLYIY